MIQEIYIIDNDNELISKLKEIFINENEYNFKSVNTNELNVALRNIPSLIIVDEDAIDVSVVDLCNQVRQNEDNNITPIIVISSNKDRNHRVEVLKTDIEYFIKKPIDDEYLYYTVKNLISLLYKNRIMSPLTGLPGNVQIQKELKKRLLKQESFSVLYLDLDNFKAYNDVYGFLKGDEIIEFTARILSKNIHQIEDSDNFVGHIGGDDFVAIVSPTDYDKVCQQMIIEFDEGAKGFYNDIDVERGVVEVANRKGIIEQFPLTTISIAVVEVDSETYKSTLEIGEIGAQVKHRAKTIMGSTYVINRRKF